VNKGYAIARDNDLRLSAPSDNNLALFEWGRKTIPRPTWINALLNVKYPHALPEEKDREYMYRERDTEGDGCRYMDKQPDSEEILNTALLN
jgi:hypothetical protein